MLHLLRVAGFTLPIASLTVALLVTVGAAGQAQVTGTGICVHSDTRYMKTQTMEDALRRQSEFHDLNLKLTEYRSKAELYIEIKRSLMTWEWSYAVVATHTGRRVDSGKIRAVTADGAANILGPLIMRSIATTLRASAPAAPAGPAAPMVAVLEEITCKRR